MHQLVEFMVSSFVVLNQLVAFMVFGSLALLLTCINLLNLWYFLLLTCINLLTLWYLDPLRTGACVRQLGMMSIGNVSGRLSGTKVLIGHKPRRLFTRSSLHPSLGKEHVYYAMTPSPLGHSSLTSQTVTNHQPHHLLILIPFCQTSDHQTQNRAQALFTQWSLLSMLLPLWLLTLLTVLYVLCLSFILVTIILVHLFSVSHNPRHWGQNTCTLTFDDFSLAWTRPLQCFTRRHGAT